jgi:hypothetical protein
MYVLQPTCELLDESVIRLLISLRHNGQSGPIQDSIPAAQVKHIFFSLTALLFFLKITPDVLLQMHFF